MDVPLSVMNFQPDVISVQSIRAYGPGWIEVAGQKITHSIVISSGGELMDWQCARFEDLTCTHFEQLARLKTGLVIFGSGPRQRFVSGNLTRVLVENQIGMECMDTPAACRTYNVLVSEGRHVAAALLI
jgi:uncharacterized protein